MKPVFRRSMGMKLIVAVTIAMARVTALADEPTVREVSFVSHGVRLSGTVFAPQPAPAVAAVVFVQGAGRETRDEQLARTLTRCGLAVIVYDKRGVGQSDGTYVGPEVGTNNVSRKNLSLLADDATSAMRSLQRQKVTQGTPKGYLGISQAGWIIPIAALKSRQTRFIVLWSGAVETTHEDVLFERLASDDPAFWDHHSHAEVRAAMKQRTDELDWSNYDPRDALTKLKIPGFWLFGARDRNMYVDLSIDRLSEIIAGGHPNFGYRVYPNYDHHLGNIDVDILVPTVEWIKSIVSKRQQIGE